MKAAPRYLLIAAAILIASASCAHAEPAVVASVTDGDTFRLTTGERIRIAGIDAPETQEGQAHCRAEILRGQDAARQLRVMLQGRSVEITRVGESYQRTVATVRFNGQDLAAELVRRGLAQWWPRGARKPQWCS